MIAPHHRRGVAKIVHVEGRGLQHELIIQHLAAERLGVDRHQGEKSDHQPSPEPLAPVGNLARDAPHPQLPERRHPKNKAQQDHIITKPLHQQTRGLHPQSDKAEVNRRHRRQPEQRQAKGRAPVKDGVGRGDRRRHDGDGKLQGRRLIKVCRYCSRAFSSSAGDSTTGGLGGMGSAVTPSRTDRIRLIRLTVRGVNRRSHTVSS